LIKSIEKKLREAKFFLEKMIHHERLASNAKEPFEFYLSAFLSAGMSVRDAFQVRQDRKRNEAVKKWKRDWEAHLTPKDVWDFMRKDRNHEVHAGGSSRTVKTENTELGLGTHSLGPVTHILAGPPDVPPAIIHTRAYYFTIKRKELKATEACGEYLALLQRMVADFKASSV
jgi:hypothetical protein